MGRLFAIVDRRKRGGGGGTIGLRNGSSAVLITVPHTCSPYGAVLLIAFLPQPHSTRPAPNISPCLKFLDNCLSCLLMQLKTWIYASWHVACRKGSEEFAMPLLFTLVWMGSYLLVLWRNIFLCTIVYQQLTSPEKCFVGVLNLQERFTYE